jgi:hypothetical protein
MPCVRCCRRNIHWHEARQLPITSAFDDTSFDDLFSSPRFVRFAVADRELDDESLGSFIRSASRSARKAVSDAGQIKLVRQVGNTVHDVGQLKVVRQLGHTVQDVGKGVAAVAKPIAPIVASAAKIASHATPLGLVARSAYGAVSAALRGQNVFMGALDGAAGSIIAAALVKVGVGALRGENLLKAAKLAAKGGIDDAKEAVRFAAMVAPFVPGIGTGVGAALGAADALANGQPITQALVAGVRGSIPGGAIAQAAFDTAAQLVQGKRIDQALLTAARNQLPPGPVQAAFDTSLALAQGKKLQDAVLTGAGRLLPASPYSADAVSFARRALAGENLGHAALSTAGNAVLRRVQQQGGDLIATAQGRVQAVAAPLVAKAVPRAPVTFDQAFIAADRSVRREADLFQAGFGGRRGSVH